MATKPIAPSTKPKEFPYTIVKSISALILLSLIDTLERFLRVILIFLFLHLALSYSDFGRSLEIYSYGMYTYILISLAYMVVTFYHHRLLINKNKNSFTIVQFAKNVFRSMKQIYSPQYLTMSRFILLTSTMLQSIVLLIVPLIVGFGMITLISLVIIFTYFVVVYFSSKRTDIFQILSVGVTQLLLFLLHLSAISFYFIWVQGQIHIFLILYFFALRLSLLYFGQLVDFFVGISFNIRK